MACPMAAPRTAPSDQEAWKLVTMEAPQRRWTRRPCAFWATSTMASVPPMTRRQAAKTIHERARPAPRSASATTSMPRLATLAEVRREMSQDAANPATRAPTLAVATACPKAALLRPSCSTISGNRGTRLAKPKPLARNTRYTAARARSSPGPRRGLRRLCSGMADSTGPDYRRVMRISGSTAHDKCGHWDGVSNVMRLGWHRQSDFATQELLALATHAHDSPDRVSYGG